MRVMRSKTSWFSKTSLGAEASTGAGVFLVVEVPDLPGSMSAIPDRGV